jgi:hypothetical protein
MTLYYYEEMTMREIGLALVVVESRVSQVHASAVVHLRAALKDLAAHGAFERPALREPPAKLRAEPRVRDRVRAQIMMAEGQYGRSNG